MKRLLFLVHRWVGVVLALFMLLWFSSGLIIAFSGSVTQSRGQQLAHSETLSPEAGWLSLGEAWTRSSKARDGRLRDEGARELENAAAEAPENRRWGRGENSIVDARLLHSGGEPHWLVEDDLGRRFSISAIDGELQEFSVEQARRIGEQWLANNKSGPGPSPAIAYLDTLDATSSLRNYQALKPFHRFAVNDGEGTELLISARSGEVLQAASRLERGLYLAGDWLHLFRPLDALGAGELRRTVLTWTGFAAACAGLTGLIIGWLRWRPGWFGKPTYSQGRAQPYRAFWLRWHFWSGLIGGAFAMLWASSGFLSTNPGQIFSPLTASNEELARYLGGEAPAAAMNWRPERLSSTADGAEVVELGWRRLGDQAVLLAYTRDGRRLPQTVAGATAQFDDRALLAAVQRLAGPTQIAEQTLQRDYDSYYYPNHHQGSIEKPLPVVRVELADAGHTHLYVDPQDGRLLLKQDSSRRAYRWLYNAAHHWDFGWLYRHPLWDVWMATWIAFGLVLSVSSVVIGWRRLRRTFGAEEKSSRKAPSSPALAPAVATES
ncbi:PepSY-associated TM helix domain-containing protein [Methylocapsa polymorpha]|uniref:PepSY-associated TM helix domain-containing protein n=1 Tax=Methylocapsa polymorpha TaxID=3080828 RepID=A0ABZ0HW80_9HYPH|nr:PepSY-associated TM helix domain-containing protein [Methylocapsa sp. RX1]